MRIVLWDDGAAYPITIDPLMTSAIWTAESDQDGANFGFSVAVAGDVDGDGFSDVIVGAPLFETVSGTGRAFLYLGSASGPAGTASWTADGSQAGERFGYAVAPAGDVNGDGYDDVLVGAPLYIAVTSNEGRAYLFLGSAAGLAASPAWTVDGTQSGEQFGRALATAGDVNGDGYDDVLVGAPFRDTSVADGGRTILYLGSGSPSGLGGAAWSAETAQTSSYFGVAVATAGDVNGDGYADVLIGAPLYDDEWANEGRIFVWDGGPGGLGPNGVPGNADWVAEGNQADAYFGAAVAGVGDVNGDGYGDILIGAYGYEDSPSESGEGRVFFWYGGSGGLGPFGNPGNPDRALESNQSGASLGFSVGAAGDVNGDGFGDVVVGANWFDNGQTTEGRAFVYLGAAEATAAQPSSRLQAGQVDGRVGFVVGSAGDINGDGYSDVIVGAPTFDNGQAEEGRVFVYHGSAAGINPPASWTTESNQAAAFFGVAVAGAGDVNGDGYDDVVVGAHQFDSGQTDEGAAFVYHGSPTGLFALQAWQGEGNQAGSYYGASVSGAGDVNGDGYADLVVGAPLQDNGETDEGRAFVYLGGPAGLSVFSSQILEGGQVGAQLGWSVAAAGDVNRDGRSDIVVGAPYYDANGGFGDAGLARLHLGARTGIQLVPAWTATGGQDAAAFGASVASAGDVNDDGYGDLIVGAPTYDSGQVDEGLAYLFHGTALGASAAAVWSAEGNQLGSDLGRSVASAGDVNGDGYSDVIVGATSWNDGQPSEGRAWVYLGSASGLSSAPVWTFDNDVADSHFGRSVAGAGDVNGDGFSDIIVGSPDYNDGIGPEGRAWIFLGNGGDGLDRPRIQRKAIGVGPIAALGISDSETSIQLRALGRSAGGRSSVRLEWEFKPLGQPFSASGLGVGTFVNTGAPGSGGSAVVRDEVASGLTASTVYKWRLRIASRSPYFPHTPWLSVPDSASTLGDVRTKILDADMDGWHSTDDCNDADPTLLEAPTEVVNLVMAAIPGGHRLTWTGQATTAGTGTVYDVFSGDVSSLRPAGDFSFGACAAENLATTQYDATGPNPPPGQAVYFILRAQNGCPGGTGTYGTANRDTTAGASAGACN